MHIPTALVGENESGLPEALLEAAVAQRTRSLRADLAWSQTRQRAMSELLTHARHDLRSPLHTILGYARLLTHETSGVTLDECAKAISDAGGRLMASIEGLLDVSCDSFDPLSDEPQPVGWNEFFYALSRDAQLLAQCVGNTSVVRLRGKAPQTVLLDVRRLRWVLRMLLTCANYGTQRREVALDIEIHCGVAGVQLEFNLQVPDRTVLERSEAAAGDVAMAMQWLKRGGGLMRIDVGDEAGSAQVRMRLGCAMVVGPVVAAPANDQFANGYQGRRRTLLVVDDDIGNLTLLREVLGGIGFVVIVAASGREGILSINQSIDLLITDQIMGDGDGWELLRALRHRLPHCPAILMSGVDEVRSGHEENSRFSAVLRKPADFQQLLDVIGRLLSLDWNVSRPAVRADGPLFQSAVLSEEQWRRLSDLVRLGLVTDILEFGAALQSQTADDLQRKLGDAIVKSVSQLDFGYLQQLIDGGRG